MPRRRRPPNWRNRSSGAAAVEFAVIAPVLFLCVFGLIELSRMIMVQQAFTNAAREGCRQAALATTQSAAAVDSFVRNRLKPVVPNAQDTSKLKITITPSNISSLSSGASVTVAVSMPFSNVSWIPGSYVGGDSFEITGHAIKQRE